MWLLTGPSAPETTRVATTTATLSTMTANEAGATTTLQRLEQDLKRVQSEIDACNKELKEADFDRILQQFTKEVAEHNRELRIAKDNLVELEAAAEELQALPQDDMLREAAILKNKRERSKEENRKEELENALADLRANLADLRANLADTRANQKDARRDLAAKRQSIYDQLKRLDDREKRIREQMEKAAAQTGQLSFPVTRTTLWYHHSVGLTCAPEICLVA